MANAHADEGVPADVRRWDPETRRNASLIVLALGGLFLVGALLFFGIAAASSGWFLWITIAVLVILLLVQLAIVATGIATEEQSGPEWLRAEPAAAGAATAETGGAEPEPEPEGPDVGYAPDQIDLRCPECAEMFTVDDTGERPLHTECPHCGAEGHVDLDEPAGDTHDHERDHEHDDESEPVGIGGLPEEDEEPAEEAGGEPIALQCPACDTQFEVEDTGERPLEATCPGCGRGGTLKS